jgi:hypothetical protein
LTKKAAQILIAPNYQGRASRIVGQIQEKSTNLSTAFVDIARSNALVRFAPIYSKRLVRRGNLPRRDGLP